MEPHRPGTVPQSHISYEVTKKGSHLPLLFPLPSPRAPGHLHIISVDNGACDVGEQVNELLLKATHTVWDLIDDYLNTLVVPQDINADDGSIIVTSQVSGHNIYHKISRTVGHEEIKGT